MVRIEGLKLAPGQDEQLLRGKAARLLRVPEGDILSLQVLRRAIDAPKNLGLRDRTALPPFVSTFARWLVLSLWGWTRTRCWCYWVGTWPRAGLPHRAS